MSSRTAALLNLLVIFLVATLSMSIGAYVGYNMFLKTAAPTVSEAPAHDDKTEEQLYRTLDEQYQIHQAYKEKWLAENPSVDYLFDTEKRTDVAYVLDYISRNGISGDCALIWREDVICTMQNKLVFPTTR